MSRRSARGLRDRDAAGDSVGVVVRTLHEEYGEADLGNLSDPIDELVYISLTRQTHAQNAGRSWEKIVAAGGPTALVDMPEDDLSRLIERGGFSRQKARWIKRSLEIVRERMGSLTLDGVSDWNDEELEAFLRSLPGISIKSAKCIMLYSLGRAVLPVDTHVRRVATRAGLVASGISERVIHDELEAHVPPNDRYSFHVNCIWHGRKVCTALRPRCDGCVICRHCAHPEVSCPAHEMEARA
jgi:endonuclease III